MMQLNITIISDSVIIIEEKRVENRLWEKSEFCAQKKQFILEAGTTAGGPIFFGQY